MEPRKSPVQARSSASVGAILEATLQVLLEVGKERLTTTRVAERAGVSVGTLYQYFPNKSSLLQAVLRAHLTAVTEAVEHTCRQQMGGTLCQMVTAVTTAFFAAKMRVPRESLALYSVSSDVDGLSIIEPLRVRSDAALVRMLESSSEPPTNDPRVIAFMLQGAMTGVSRRILESRVPAQELDTLCHELVRMVCAYVETHRTEPA